MDIREKKLTRRTHAKIELAQELVVFDGESYVEASESPVDDSA